MGYSTVNADQQMCVTCQFWTGTRESVNSGNDVYFESDQGARKCRCKARGFENEEYSNNLGCGGSFWLKWGG